MACTNSVEIDRIDQGLGAVEDELGDDHHVFDEMLEPEIISNF